MLSEVKVTSSRSLTGKGRPWGLWAPSFLSVCLLIHDDLAQWAIPDLAPVLTVFLLLSCALGPAVVRGDVDIVHFDECRQPDCDLAPSPFSPTVCWEAPVDTIWKASAFFPTGWHQEATTLLSCFQRVAEDSAVWFNSTISTGVPRRHSFEKRLHTMLILARLLKS